jgi:hypothetical protein
VKAATNRSPHSIVQWFLTRSIPARPCVSASGVCPINPQRSSPPPWIAPTAATGGSSLSNFSDRFDSFAYNRLHGRFASGRSLALWRRRGLRDDRLLLRHRLGGNGFLLSRSLWSGRLLCGCHFSSWLSAWVFLVAVFAFAFTGVVFFFAVTFFADALAVVFLAAGFLAVDFFAAGFFAVDFFAAGFFAAAFFAAGFFAAAFLAAAFFATRLLRCRLLSRCLHFAAGFLAADFFAVVFFFAEVFEVDFFAVAIKVLRVEIEYDEIEFSKIESECARNCMQENRNAQLFFVRAEIVKRELPPQRTSTTCDPRFGLNFSAAASVHDAAGSVRTFNRSRMKRSGCRQLPHR